MDLSPVIFTQQTNRESFRQVIGLFDADTGDALDLSELTFDCEVRPLGVSVQSGYRDGGYANYNDVGIASQPIITLALGAGLTVLDLGLLEIAITATQMRSLCADTYGIALTASSDDDTRQVFLGRLPVLYGGVA